MRVCAPHRQTLLIERLQINTTRHRRSRERLHACQGPPQPPTGQVCAEAPRQTQKRPGTRGDPDTGELGLDRTRPDGRRAPRTTICRLFKCRHLTRELFPPDGLQQCLPRRARGRIVQERGRYLIVGFQQGNYLIGKPKGMKRIL